LGKEIIFLILAWGGKGKWEKKEGENPPQVRRTSRGNGESGKRGKERRGEREKRGQEKGKQAEDRNALSLI
jgi:hypothetical protein